MATPHRIDDVAGIAHLDLYRRRRTAVPEVVFAEGKTEGPAEVLKRAPGAFPAEPVLADPVGRP